MIRALFLDAAGTLIHPAEPVGAVYARIATAHGRPCTAGSIGERFARVFASGLDDPEWDRHPDGDQAERDWWRGLVGQVFSPAEEWPRFDECFEALFAHYAAPAAWSIYPEVPEVLHLARERGLTTAVVSNFDRRLHAVLGGLGLGFDLVLPSADACCRKPRTAIFDQALETLKLEPSEAYHVGDSRAADLEGARAAGLGAYLLDRPHTDLRSALAALFTVSR